MKIVTIGGTKLTELKYPFRDKNQNMFRNLPYYKEVSLKSTLLVLCKIALFLIAVYILSIILFDYLYPTILPYNFGFFNFLITLVVLIYLYQFFGFILSFIITSIVFKRTRYSGFLFELFIEFEIIFFQFFLIYFILIDPLNALILVILVSLVPLQYLLLKKPLIWDKPNTKRHRYLISNLTSQDLPYKSDILLRQYSFIDEYEDGYSFRPTFEDISDIFRSNQNINFLQNQIVRYARFLAINGDLVGYDYDNFKVELFLRTAFIQRHEIARPIKFLKKFFKVLRKRNLTTVTINLESRELNVKLNEYDYDYLNDVTYHLLVERILKQFKESLKNFLEDDYVKSYESIYPTVIKTNSTIKSEKIGTFLASGYIIGAFLVGPALVYANLEYNYSFFNIAVNILSWPIMIYIVVQSFDSVFYHDPLIFLSCFITGVLTILVFLIINKFKWKKDITGNKGLKIPKTQ